MNFKKFLLTEILTKDEVMIIRSELADCIKEKISNYKKDDGNFWKRVNIIIGELEGDNTDNWQPINLERLLRFINYRINDLLAYYRKSEEYKDAIKDIIACVEIARSQANKMTSSEDMPFAYDYINDTNPEAEKQFVYYWQSKIKNLLVILNTNMFNAVSRIIGTNKVSSDLADLAWHPSIQDFKSFALFIKKIDEWLPKFRESYDYVLSLDLSDDAVEKARIKINKALHALSNLIQVLTDQQWYIELTRET